MRPDGWPVRFRRTSGTNFVAAPNAEAAADATADACTNSSHLDSLVSSSPEQTAAAQIADAINKLTRNHWL